MTVKSFEEVEHYLSLLPTISQASGDRLAYIKRVLALFGDPQNAIPAIHIAGTSGKGSTAYYASSLLCASGYSVGLLVSPHVISIAERTQIDGELLAEEEYCRYINDFTHALEAHRITLTYLEFMTIFAYWLFARCAVDYMVIEVGIGGRLDMTNVMERADKVAVITDIGLDHTELLGNTIGEIASEKAGIIGDGASIVMYIQADEVMNAVSAASSRSKQVEATYVDPSMANMAISTPLPPYQQRNLRLALEAVNHRLVRDMYPKVTKSSLDTAARCAIPGRFEMIEAEGVMVLLDAAHNPQKIGALTEALHSFTKKPILYVVAFGENKLSTVSESLALLQGASADRNIIATEFDVAGTNHGALSAERLKHMAEQAGFSSVVAYVNPHEALNYSLEWARQSGSLVVVTGSFYLISMLRPRLLSR